jgi:hypothetical protein
MRLGRDGTFLALLTAAATGLAAALYAAGGTSALEAVAFVTGAACVWLTVRENVWNFPVGLNSSSEERKCVTRRPSSAARTSHPRS